MRFTDDAVAGLLDPGEREELLRWHPGGAARFWGAEGKHAGMMAKLRSGDIVFLVGGGKVKAVAEVGCQLVNPRFADWMWRKPGEPESFVHVYSLVNLRPIDTPKSKLAELCGYSAKYDFPGQRFLNDKDVDAVLDWYRVDREVREAVLEREAEERVERLGKSQVTPVEAVRKRSVVRQVEASTTVVNRVEAELVTLFIARSGHDLAAFRTASGLRADLYRECGGEVEIIEAKSSGSHRKVREALAQLLDYSAHSPRPVTTLTALFPDRPDRPGVELLLRMGIDCVFLADTGEFERVAAPAGRRSAMLPAWRGEPAN
ncbi:hypothetical protein ACOBQX_02870 [Actinokineospora sp. G85]|uniref:hypothetical protein n=1 Tax=Actinokineospora sp. G85 TaxID=3406626 RepID=UPI003C715A81